MEHWKVYISFYDGGSLEKTVDGKPCDDRLAALIQEEIQSEDEEGPFFSFMLDMPDMAEQIQQAEFTLEFSLSEDLSADGSVTVCRDPSLH